MIHRMIPVRSKQVLVLTVVIALTISAFVTSRLAAAQGISAHKTVERVYEFGSTSLSAPRATTILGTDVYTSEKGYGFEPGTSILCWKGTRRNNGNCTSNRPFFFSTVLPEGNYLVNVRFGDHQVSTSTVVKAELRG
jgi:hypothetical protein